MSGRELSDRITRLIDQALVEPELPATAPGLPPSHRGRRRAGPAPMSNDDLLAALVQAWAEGRLSSEPEAARRAGWLAGSAYRAGASTADACEQARTFLGCWLRHPSRGVGRPDGLSVLAS